MMVLQVIGVLKAGRTQALVKDLHLVEHVPVLLVVQELFPRWEGRSTSISRAPLNDARRRSA